MAGAAKNLWASLTPDQKNKIAFDFKDALRFDWHFIPRPRKGLPLKEMSGEQKALAHALLGQRLEPERLHQGGNDHQPGADPGNDRARAKAPFVTRSFTSSTSSATRTRLAPTSHGAGVLKATTWRSISRSSAKRASSADRPSWARTPPRSSPALARACAVLGEEEDLARKLVKSLDEAQRKKGIVQAEAPKDILSFAARKAKPLQPAGIMMPDLNATQKELLNSIIVLYAERLRPEIAGNDLGKILKAGVDKIGFAWAGGLERGMPHYYRIQGPTFLIEYDNTQNNANHVHSVWRDFENDFGDDLLKKHYETATADHGHTK